MNKRAITDAWNGLRRYTPARIALGRSGASLPTAEVLRFGVAHARARDAVHLPFDAAAVRDDLTALDFETIEVESAAPDRATYLRRPDLGRRLAERSRALLDALPAGKGEVVFVVADGLSSKAVHSHAAPLLREVRPLFEAAGFAIGPIVLAHQSRVALGDQIGECLRAQAVAVLIGERPGLSSPDSLGVYLTWNPRTGRADAERNCISNVRPEGLGYAEAARKVAWLLSAARSLGATGVVLKDQSDAEGALLATLTTRELR